MSTIVHWAGTTDHRTACGKWALNEDGSRRLETDINADMVDCRNCLRAYRNAKLALDQRNDHR